MGVGYWPLDRVLVVELEHLRLPATAAIALDSVANFLGVARFSELSADPVHGVMEPDRQTKKNSDGASPLRYAPGLSSSSPLWGRRQLCAPARGPHMKTLEASLRREYKLLPRLLSRVGVPELGVSSVLVAGGSYARHCSSEQFHIPKASSTASPPEARRVEEEAGWTEALAVEGRLLLDWRGEVGFEFEVTASRLRIAALACGAGSGALKEDVRVTLWDRTSREPIHIALIGPGSVLYDGFAYSAPFMRPLDLRKGLVYALTVHTAPGRGISPSGHWAIGISPLVARFRGAVFSQTPWEYPLQRDDSGWEEAYVAIASMHAI